MARRKNRSKKTTHRRRRIGATGSNNVTSILTMAAGAVLGRILTNKLSAKVNPKLLAAGQIGIGILAPKWMRGNKLVAGLGAGMAVNGAVSLAQNFGVIGTLSGIGEDNTAQLEYLGADEFAMAGDDPLSVLAGDDPLSVLAGDDFAMAGDDFAMAGDSYDEY